MSNVLQTIKFAQADSELVVVDGATVTGDAIDTAGCSEIMFVMETFSTLSVITEFKLEQDTTSAFSSATDVTGATLVDLPGSGADNEIHAIHLNLNANPSERYIRFSITEAGGTGPFDGQIYVLRAGFDETPNSTANRGLTSEVTV